MGLEHHLNADFDLSLRPRWRPPVGAAERRRIADLAWHALFLADPGDSVVVPEPAPGDFLGYLARRGLRAPELTVEPEVRSRQRLAPLGWNAAAAERNRRYDTPADHPPLDTVVRVNGRRFSAALERELGDGDHTVAVVASRNDLECVLAGLPEAPDGWLFKAEHGNAGLGNRRLRRRELGDDDLRVAHFCLEEDDAIVVERWRQRLRDLCATFEVTADGGCARFHLHEIVNTADGALIGALFEHHPDPLAEWRSAMIETAVAVATRLAREGYVGPVCVDAFVWNDAGRPRLRSLVDLNARREVSAGASNLWRRLGGAGAAYWRFFARRKLRLPDTYHELERALGADAFDPDAGSGVLVTAPLWLGAERRCPAKTAMLLIGDNRDEVLVLERRLRERFER